MNNTSLNNPVKFLPDYSAPVSVSFPFTAPSDGVVAGDFGVSSGRGSIYINGKRVGYSPVTGDDNSFFVVVNKGLQLTAASSNSSPVQTADLFFYPYK